MPEYVSPMYYRRSDTATGIYTVASGSTVSANIALHMRSIPSGATPINLTVYLYIHLLDGGTVRVSLFGVSQDRTGSGPVKLEIPGSALPSAFVQSFGVSGYFLTQVSVQNLTSRTLRFALPFEMPFLRYYSEGRPAPYYYGADPSYDQNGRPIDLYRPAGYYLWDTRFVYRGVRTAFSFSTILHSIAQLCASTQVQAMRTNLKVEGTNVRWLYQQLMRWMRITRRDGVYADSWKGVF